jgi:hypothetical protein
MEEASAGSMKPGKGFFSPIAAARCLCVPMPVAEASQ